MDPTPLQLRRHAEHCRHLAQSQFDDRVRLILNNMADDFDREARLMTAVPAPRTDER